MGCGASTAAPQIATASPQIEPAGQDSPTAQAPSENTTPVPPAVNSIRDIRQCQQQPVSIAWLQSLVVSLPASDLTATDAIQHLLGSTPTEGDGKGPAPDVVAAKRPYHFVIHAHPAPFANTVDMLHKHFSAAAQQAKHDQRKDPAQPPAPVAAPAGDVLVWLDGFPSASGSGGAAATATAGASPDTAAAAATAVSELRDAVSGAASVLLVLDDEVAAPAQLRCLYGVWLAGRCGRPLRVLAHELDWEFQSEVIVSLNVSTAEHVGLPPALRERMLVDMLGSESGAAGSTDGGTAAAAAGEGSTAATAAAASRALRDALTCSILADVRPLEHSNRHHDHLDPHHDRSSRPGTAASAARLSHCFASGGSGSHHYHATAATISSLDRAARLLEKLDRGQEAEGLFRAVLAATEAALGAAHVDTLQAAANLASILGEHGKGAEAEPLLRRVLAGYERAYGTEKAETAEASESLGLLLQQQGRQAEAEEALRTALAGYEASLGTEALQTLQAAGHLAAVLRQRGQVAEAEGLARRVLAGYEAALGPADPDTLGAVNNLALLLKGAGRTEEAEPLYRRALAGCEEQLGPDAHETLTAIANLAALLQAAGRLDEAEPLLRRALAGREAALGPAHPDTLGAANNLAVLLQAAGQHEAAEPLFRRALEGWERCMGPDHPDTLTSAYNLGVLLEALGRPAEALEHYRREAAGRGRRGEAARAEARQERIAALEAQLEEAAASV